MIHQVGIITDNGPLLALVRKLCECRQSYDARTNASRFKKGVSKIFRGFKCQFRRRVLRTYVTLKNEIKIWFSLLICDQVVELLLDWQFKLIIYTCVVDIFLNRENANAVLKTKRDKSWASLFHECCEEGCDKEEIEEKFEERRPDNWIELTEFYLHCDEVNNIFDVNVNVDG